MNGITENTERLAAVKARQTIWVDWMRQATDGLADDALVTTISRCTPFGTYLLEIRATPI